MKLLLKATKSNAFLTGKHFLYTDIAATHATKKSHQLFN
jgi:hypothetical protein